MPPRSEVAPASIVKIAIQNVLCAGTFSGKHYTPRSQRFYRHSSSNSPMISKPSFVMLTSSSIE